MPVPSDQVDTMLGPLREQLAQADRDGATDAAPTDGGRHRASDFKRQAGAVFNASAVIVFPLVGSIF